MAEVTVAERLVAVTPEVAGEARRVLGLDPATSGPVAFVHGLGRSAATGRAVWDPTRYRDYGFGAAAEELVEFHIDPAVYVGTGMPGPLLVPAWQAAAFVEAGLGHVPDWDRT